MTWLTENPWPPIFILGIAACVMVAVWTSQKRGAWLVGALTAVIAAAAVFFVEKAVITEGERVEQHVRDLVEAFVRGDRDRVVSFFSARAPELNALAVRGLDLVEFPSGIDVKDMSVRVSNENTRAISLFRANGVVSVKGLGAQQQMASRWQVTWQKEGNDWKIVEVVRLHPYKDESMQILEQRPQ
jgi:ketosteroid isomerase-like protein